MIDKLENRRMFDVSLSTTGTMTIDGTHNDDIITMEFITKNDIQPDGMVLATPYYSIKNKGQLVREVNALKVIRIRVNLFKGNDSFTAIADDTTRTIIDGAAGNDSIVCGASNDSVNGGSGNDTITGNEGEDTIDGGDGDDSITGDDDIDSIISSAGADSLSGGDDLDTLDLSLRTAAMNITLDGVANDLETTAQTGNVQADFETILGGSGADLIDASFLLADTLSGAAQAEWIYGNGGKNTIIGGDGDDVLVGGVNNDSITGGAGDDFIDGHRGRDSLAGGDGDDQFYTADDNQRDTLDGGDGANVAYYDFLDRVRNLESITPPPNFVRP